VIFASIACIIIAVAGGWPGAVGAVLLIVGGATVIGKCCSGGGEKARTTFMAGLIMNILAGILLLVSMALLLALYFSASDAISGACGGSTSCTGTISSTGQSCSIYNGFSSFTCNSVAGCTASSSGPAPGPAPSPGGGGGVSQCNGNPTASSGSTISCSTYNGISSGCNALSQYGCTYSGSTCSGTYQACRVYTTSSMCGFISGCTWGRRRNLAEDLQTFQDLRAGRKLQAGCSQVANAVGIIILVAGLICAFVMIFAFTVAFYDFRAMNNPGAPNASTTVVAMGTAAVVAGQPVKAVAATPPQQPDSV